jgi:hypothetical protein
MISQYIVWYPQILHDTPGYCMIPHYIRRYMYPKIIYSMIQSMIQWFNLWFNDSILGFTDSILGYNGSILEFNYSIYDSIIQP